MKTNILTLFLRISIASGFLSAVADRLGMYTAENSVWGNWQAFTSYTQQMNPWLPATIISPLAILATVLEVVFATALLVGFKTKLAAKLSGFLLLLFGISMTFAFGLKSALDYSVFGLAAAAFSLSIIKNTFIEADSILQK